MNEAGPFSDNKAKLKYTAKILILKEIPLCDCIRIVKILQ